MISEKVKARIEASKQRNGTVQSLLSNLENVHACVGMATMLTVKDGNLHMVADGVLQVLSASYKRQTIIYQSVNGSISTSAEIFIREHNHTLIKIDLDGNSYTDSSISHFDQDFLVKQATLSQEEKLQIAKEITVAKINNQLRTLLEKNIADVKTQAAMNKALQGVKNAKTEEIRGGYEGSAATAYFKCLQENVSFEFIGGKKVESHWKNWSSRNTVNGSRKDATDPVNASLNVGYALATFMVKLELTAKKILNMSLFHVAGLEYDLVETVRADVDRIVLDYLTTNKVRVEEFIVKDGVVRLERKLYTHLYLTVFSKLAGKVQACVDSYKQSVLDIHASKSSNNLQLVSSNRVARSVKKSA
jgi:CRISPR/Cas system-associated endonuclease Cas1